MKAGKYLLLGCILGVLLCTSFAQRHLPAERVYAKKQIEPIKVNTKGQGLQNFQQMIEKHFTAGDRLLMPLGVFAVTNYIRNTDEMGRLVKNGITFIHRYTGELTIERSREDIDNATKAGVPMAFCLPTRRYHKDKEWWRNFLQERNLPNQKQIKIWYLHGEPEDRESLNQLRYVAELLHEVDGSRRPVMSYHHSLGTVAKEMGQFLDALIFGAYPGVTKGKGYPRVRIAYRIDSVHKRYEVPVIAALESYNTPSGWPSPEDIKFDAYLSLIHGARGIMWYSYAQIRNNPELLEAVLEISRLLNGPEYLGEVFLKGEDNQNIHARIVAGPTVFGDGFHSGMKRLMPNNPSIHWRAYNHRGHIYVVIVNCCEILKKSHSQADEEDSTVKVEFRGLGADCKITLLDGESVYDYQPEALTVTLKPLGAAVFKITP